MTVEWIETPWPQPSAASIREILDRYGIGPGETVNAATLLDDATPEDNVVLTAGGVFGPPTHPADPRADYSRFSGVVGDTNDKGGFDNYAYLDGELLLKEHSNQPIDTLAFWTKATA